VLQYFRKEGKTEDSMVKSTKQASDHSNRPLDTYEKKSDENSTRIFGEVLEVRLDRSDSKQIPAESRCEVHLQ
jgi:hypothetical protein